MILTAVVNTYNEGKNIKSCLESLDWVDELVIVDMGSTDDTVTIAKQYVQKIYVHPYTSYVEPARNFAIGKASGDWILIIDADEVVSASLSEELRACTKNTGGITFYRIPRKNIIFGKWIKQKQWWPDYQIRLFKKGAVKWKEEIHSVPNTRGIGKDLLADERHAIVHNHYQSVTKYVERLNRYTSQQAKELQSKDGYVFKWKELLTRPIDEFLRRYFFAEGYRDGMHGLVLALLQAFSELIVVCKLWELERFVEVENEEVKKGFSEIIAQKGKELNYWLRHSGVRKNIYIPLRNFFS